MGFRELGESLDTLFKPVQKEVKKVKRTIKKEIRNISDAKNAADQASSDMIIIMGDYKFGRMKHPVSELGLSHGISDDLAQSLAKLGHYEGRQKLTQIYQDIKRQK